LELHDARQSTGNFSERVVANFLLQFVTPGHSRSKNGVASLAYDPVVHGDSSMPHGLPDHLTPRRRLRAFCPAMTK
jgi:hypothetical protein